MNVFMFNKSLESRTTEELLNSLKDGQLQYGKDWVKYSETGDLFVSGKFVFKLIDSYGLPLEIVLDTLKQNKAVVLWDDFVRTAWNHGWLSYQIWDKICFGFTEAIEYNESYLEEIKKRLRLFISVYDPAYQHLLKE